MRHPSVRAVANMTGKAKFSAVNAAPSKGILGGTLDRQAATGQDKAGAAFVFYVHHAFAFYAALSRANGNCLTLNNRWTEPEKNGIVTAILSEARSGGRVVWEGSDE